MAREVVYLRTRERILMLRLMEKAARHPAYAEALGLTCVEKEKENPSC